MEPTITKTKGIDSILGEYTPGKVEEEQELDQESQHKIAALLDKYEKLLQYHLIMPAEVSERFHVKHDINEILTPQEISSFFLATVKYEDKKNYSRDTYFFIGKLIQNSYGADHNDFYLDTRVLPLHHKIGYFLEGSEERPLNLNIQGDIGHQGFEGASWLNITVEGSAGNSLATGIKNSNITVKGDTGHYFAFYAEESTFTFYGRVGYYATGDPLEFQDSRATRCTFKTPNLDTNRRLHKYVRGEGNKIILMEND